MSSGQKALSYSLLTNVLLHGYRALKKSGVLDYDIPKQFFQGSYFLYKRYLEDPFYNLARRYPDLFRDGIVLDIGANCGYTALVFSTTAAQKVYAFEPDPDNIKMLKDLVTKKRLTQRVNVVAAAVGASDGELTLWRNPGHHADHRIATDSFKAEHSDVLDSAIRVPVVSIDAFLERNCPISRVSFIKIDVQGYEPAVCEGLLKTLNRFPDVRVALEYCPAQIDELGFSSSGLLELFESMGFSWYLIGKNGTLKRFSQVEIDNTISRRGYVDLLATRALIPL
jgi:FkbM family methyltransferase